MPHDELIDSIDAAPQRGTGGTPVFSGKLSAEQTLGDVLRQVMSSSEMHGMLRILSKGCSGYIGVYMGTVITGAHATTTGEQGLEAVRTLLGARSGLYGFVALPERPKELQQNLYVSLEALLDDGRPLVEAFESMAQIKRSQEVPKPSVQQEAAPAPVAEESLIDGDLTIFSAWGEDIAPVVVPKTTRSLNDLVNTKSKIPKISLNLGQPEFAAGASAEQPDFWVTDAAESASNNNEPQPNPQPNPELEPRMQPEPDRAQANADSWGGWAPTAPIVEPSPDAPPPKPKPAFNASELSAIPTPKVASRDSGAITGRHPALYANDTQRTTGRHAVMRNTTATQIAKPVAVQRKSAQVIILENIFVASMVVGVVAAGIFFTKEAQQIGKLNDQFVIGQGLIKKHDYQGALSTFAKLDNTDFNRTALLMGKATAHAGLSEWSAAIGEYDQILDSNPNVFPARYGRALCYLKSSFYDKAIEDATKCIETKPKNGAIYLLRAVAYAHQGDFDKALADCETATKCGTAAEASVHATLAFIFFQKKDYDDSIAEYTAAIEKDPKNGQFYAGRAEAYERVGNKIAAASDASQAIFFDPHDIGMLILRAQCALKSGDRNKALEDLNKAAKLAPCAEVLKARANLFLAEKNYKAAYSDLEQLIAIAPGDMNAREQLKAADAQIRSATLAGVHPPH